jgi:CRP/FNR family transcriptional regulator, anaerobic regulatory protein
MRVFKLPEEIINDIERDYKSIWVKKNTILVTAGEIRRKVSFVKSGLLRVYLEDDESGREVLLYEVRPHEICTMGLFACMHDNDMKRLANCRVECDTELITIDAENIKSWQTKYVSWNNLIIDVFLSRYNDLLNTINEITFENIEGRIIKSLKKEAGSSLNNKVAITHQELANKLGTTRVVVSRILKKLEHEGKIKLMRGEIHLVAKSEYFL